MVYDNNGIIHESNSWDEAYQEYLDTEEFEGDLVFAKEVSRRR
ncbi:MAG: hypothetical protein ACTSVR_05465 [Candidatus Thorarchaeota archaeon]